MRGLQLRQWPCACRSGLSPYRRSFVHQARLLQQESSQQDAPTTHFGFETVPESAKEGKVRDVFSSVASSYDTMNDFMSLGIHRLWKDHFVRSLNPGADLTSSDRKPWKMLDVAGGTGDIAFRILDHATKIRNDLESHVIISDINPEMLMEGRKRSLGTDYAGSRRLSFLESNAEKLEMIESDSIDLYTVAFGIRNFTNKQRALEEAFRVLRPGGVFACLEFSKVNNSLFNAIYKRWSFSAIPIIGQLITADRASYQYLVESIEKFPSQTEFRDMIAQVGFMIPGEGFEDLTGGIAAIHKGVKPVTI
ncbi:MAG: 2-hexaprenyl-6-methoxy-1,4-benzoquinone methyltransferase [Icmadophila ericetorum]|nr:2-hexaprenyl-6-methoxy-1,4-benzoquinone methyltransferase [Icmadophila ericetorum]